LKPLAKEVILFEYAILRMPDTFDGDPHIIARVDIPLLVETTR